MKRYADLIAEEGSMPGKPKEESKDGGITPEQLNALEKHLDAIWGHLKIDFDFTQHFFERVNDPRNKKQITIGELNKIFTDVYQKYGSMIANKVKPETEGKFDSVLTDSGTKVNSPVVLIWDKKRRRLEMKAKTVMRVNHFYTHPDQERLVVSHFDPEKKMKQKTYSDLIEWVGFNTPSVASSTTVQAVDDVDTAAFAVEEPDVLDKLNAYCHEIAHRQYINPYYALNTLWRKLSLIGLDFNLKSVMLTGIAGQTTVPLTRFGGRYGYLPHQHTTDGKLIHNDDGFNFPGGLNIVFSWVKTAGVYSLDAHIEHGSDVLPIGEDLDEALVKGKDLTPAQHKEVLSAFVHRHTGEHKPSWANKPMPNGNKYEPTHKTDKEWVHDHAFHVTKKTGKLSRKHQSAVPHYMAETEVKKK